MRKMGLMMLAGVAVAGAFVRADGQLSDDALKENIVRFVTLPGRMCGHALVDFRDEFRSRKLTNRSWFDGDTNRLARLIAELAQTNDVELSSQMVESLGEYGTPAQLPFLYSCATNPAIGNLAVRAVFNIEGITSNSLEVARSYLFSTNKFSFDGVAHRANVCVDLFTNVYEDSNLAELRPRALETATNFMDAVEIMPNVLDGELCRLYDGFQISRRRLSSLRSARERIIAELVDATTNNYEVGRRTHCYIAQTNYLQNAINELVAYPEANLPD